MDPARHVRDHERFKRLREELNRGVAFEGLALGEDGKLGATSEAKTIPEAHRRANENGVGQIECRERLGGLLRYYYRAAA